MENQILSDKRAILISVKTQRERDTDVLSSIEELKELSGLCGIETVDCMIQRMEKINFIHYIGSGKIEELKIKIKELKINIVVIDSELTYIQIKNLEESLGVNVIDRTGIILEVFYKSAKTKETKLLFDMAKLKYRISRGNEEKKELLKEKLHYLQNELKEIDKHYKLLKENRKKSNVPLVAIVGYSNVGKSSILNKLTNENIYVEDKLFATMDPTTRIVKLPSKGEALFTDTVGFIRKLPDNLLKLFHISIDEIKNADVILHIMDISSADFKQHKKVVNDTLELLEVDKSKIIEVYNKVDLVEDVNDIIEDEKSVFISVKDNVNIDKLLIEAEGLLRGKLKQIELIIPYKHADILSIVYDSGESIEEEYIEDGIYIKGYIKAEKYYYIEEFQR